MTPYDTAMRIRRREVDRIKIDIAMTVTHIDGLARQDGEIAARIVEERRQASALRLPADAWHDRMRSERARIADARRTAEALLATLRARATEAFGALRALEEAASRHREEAARAAAVAEQARLDDVATSRFLREQRQCP